MGDLAGLARSYARERRLAEALACLDAATARPVTDLARPVAPTTGVGQPMTTSRPSHASSRVPDDEPWWSPRRPADFGGRPAGAAANLLIPRTQQFDTPWTSERIAIDRAHLLRRIGRYAEAAEAWAALAAGPGRTAILAAIELAKLQEHRLRDRPAALVTTHRGLGFIERRRRLGLPEPTLEADLRRRVARLTASRRSARRRR